MHIRIHAQALWRMPLSRRELENCLAAMLAAAPDELCPTGGVELYLLRDGAIAGENERLLECPGPTNVLSFPSSDADMPGVLLFSTDTLHRECLLYGQVPREHAVRLLAHGMAHLMGLDHGRDMNELCAILEEAATAC